MIHSANMKYSIPFALILIFGQCTFAADDISQKLSKADDLLNKGKPKDAAAILRVLIAGHPDNAAAHMELGAALASLAENNNYDAAIAEEQTALKLDPKSYGARKILGKIYANLNKSQESVKMLEEAAALMPTSYATQRDLGKAQMAAGKNEEAISSFRKAAALNPEKVDPHIKLAFLFSKKENHKEAIAEGRKAVQLDLSNPETHLALANALLASGDKAGAVEPFETAMDKNMSRQYRNPLTAASATSGLGWAFSGKESGEKGLAEAVAYQRKAIKIFPSFSPAYIRLAELLSKQGNNKEADLIYKTSMKYSGDEPSIATTYAKFLGRTGRPDEARTMLNKVLEKSPDNKAAAEALAEIDHNKSAK